VPRNIVYIIGVIAIVMVVLWFFGMR